MERWESAAVASRAVNGCNRHVKGNLYKLIRHTGQVVGRLSLKLCTASRGILSFSHDSSGSSGGVGGIGGLKHEIYAAAFSGNLFYDLVS